MSEELETKDQEKTPKLKSRRQRKEVPEVEAVSEKQEVDADADVWITVKAKSIGRDDNVAGFYGQHTRYAGDKFEVLERHFSKTWMLRV